MNISKKQILATTVYSGGGQWTEEAIRGQGIKSYCLKNCIFETNDEDDLKKFREHILSNKIKAVIIDCFWTPDNAIAISYGVIDFARQLGEHGVKVFCICRERGSRAGCGLYEIGKLLKFRDMSEAVPHIVRLETFSSEIFAAQGGKVFARSGGDGGIESVEHALRTHQAFTERDWARAVECVIAQFEPAN